MADLLPPLVWVHLTVGIVGALIMIYTFLQRLLKEQLLISEVIMATFVGVILGPAVGGVFFPRDWYTDQDDFFQFFQEVMRVLLAIQLVSATMSLPVSYVEKEWKSLAIMLGPIAVVTWGMSTLITLLFLGDLGIHKCLIIAACLTPTDPVLASTILEGRFAAKHLPRGLRHLLAAESAANDGSAFPFVMLPILLLQSSSTEKALTQWVFEVWGYQVVLAVIVGILFGTFAGGLRWLSTKYALQDEPSFLAHVIGLALGIVGLVRAIGSDGILAVFAGSISFANREPTAEEGRYDAIYGLEIIITISFFILFGSLLPLGAWSELGIGRLFLFSLTSILFRRLPVVLAMCGIIPELQREGGAKKSTFFQAAFAGFYGPIGVGALFYTTFSQEQLGEETTFEVVSFVVLSSLLIHGVLAAPLSRLLFRSLAVAKRQCEGALEPYGERDPVLDGLYIEAMDNEVQAHISSSGTEK